MASGCDNNKTNKCVDPISSDCVLWQGTSVPLLNICTNDTITEVVQTLLDQLTVIATGKGITLNTLIASCTDLNTLISNSDKSLEAILKIILEKECSLQAQIDAINTQLSTTPNIPITVDLKCLPNTVTNRTTLDQALIDKICDLQSQIDVLNTKIPQTTSITDVVTDVLISTLTSCNGGITVSGTGANRKLNFQGIIPIGGRIFGEFPLSSFDNSGLGQGVYCGYALCNGLNGTRDMRGFVPAMATNIQGAGSQVTTTSVGMVKGNDTVSLVANNIPDHNHTLVDPGHKHNLLLYRVTLGGGNGVLYAYTDDPTNTTKQTQPATTNISVGGVVGQTGQPINNIQPTLYGVWIQRIS